MHGHNLTLLIPALAVVIAVVWLALLWAGMTGKAPR